jgi:hypothetical protein
LFKGGVFGVDEGGAMGSRRKHIQLRAETPEEDGCSLAENVI